MPKVLGLFAFSGPHHTVNNLPLNSCRSTGMGAAVLLVGGFWLNCRWIIWKSQIFCILLHLFIGIIWLLILCGILVAQQNWLQIHIQWLLSPSGTLVVFIQKKPEVIHCISLYSQCLLHPSIHLCIQPPHWAYPQWGKHGAVLKHNLKTSTFHWKYSENKLCSPQISRFPRGGPVWQGTVVLQPWEGPFCPKMCSNWIGQCKWSISSWSDPVGHVSQKAPSAVGGTF